MTLPFRRRHHDDEAAHDRARLLSSDELIEPLAEEETAWLARHLEACSECRVDRDGFRADHDLLRSLRDTTPEPPRDLWARTSAALDREKGRPAPADVGSGSGTPRRRRFRVGGLPLSAAMGALVVAVVIGTSLVPGPQRPNASPGSSSAVGQATPPDAGPTPITVAANPIDYLRVAADGSWALYVTDVDTVCPRSALRCGPQLPDGQARPLLIGKPSSVTISPHKDQLVIESDEEGNRGKILVVPVPAASQPATPAPESTAPETPGPPTQPVSEPPTTEPTPIATPPGQLEIATGVTVVGDVAYSADGHWLAFSARPIDGSTGPDLYLWAVGAPTATVMTTDHRTYFSAWLGNRILASSLELVPGPDATAEPTPPTEPASPVEARARSFVLDPVTLERTQLQQPDVWLPVVDPQHRFVSYWSGTLLSSDNGITWTPGTGDLVLDRWASPDGDPSTPVAPTDATSDPSATADPDAVPTFGPVGAGVPVVDGPVGAFKARFDPETGTRLAVWVAEQPTDAIGRLHLLVLDPATGAIAAESPLPGVRALQRFSIDRGRLAWVSPSGQDGQESSVKVLGWTADDFGEIETAPSGNLFIVP